VGYAGSYVKNAVGGCFSKEVKAPEANRTALKV
jgi:hypothetical protein